MGAATRGIAPVFMSWIAAVLDRGYAGCEMSFEMGGEVLVTATEYAYTGPTRPDGILMAPLALLMAPVALLMVPLALLGP